MAYCPNLTEARQLILRAKHFQIIDGVLYHLHFLRTKRLNEIKPILHQLCVPDVLREDLLKAYHNNVTASSDITGQ